jgi:hypothetical protein
MILQVKNTMVPTVKISNEDEAIAIIAVPPLIVNWYMAERAKGV